jgi:hypothetical protein
MEYCSSILNGNHSYAILQHSITPLLRQMASNKITQGYILKITADFGHIELHTQSGTRTSAPEVEPGI